MKKLDENDLRSLQLIGVDLKDKNFDHILNTVDVLKNQFICIYDSTQDELVFQKNIQEILGYPNHRWTVKELFQIFHPEDLKKIIKVFNRVKKFYFNDFKKPFSCFSFTARLKKADGTYCHVLNQEFVLEYDHSKNYILTLNIGTEISHFNLDDTIKINLTGPGSEKLNFDDLLIQNNVKVSNRELQILNMISEGLDSHSIAEALKISVHTVNTHRRNLIIRFKVDNTAQLVSVAAKMGYLS